MFVFASSTIAITTSAKSNSVKEVVYLCWLVCLFVSNSTRKHVNEFSWKFGKL